LLHFDKECFFIPTSLCCWLIIFFWMFFCASSHHLTLKINYYPTYRTESSNLIHFDNKITYYSFHWNHNQETIILFPTFALSLLNYQYYSKRKNMHCASLQYLTCFWNSHESQKVLSANIIYMLKEPSGTQGLIIMFLSSVLYWGGYETLKGQVLRREGRSRLTFFESFFSGAAAGTVSLSTLVLEC